MYQDKLYPNESVTFVIQKWEELNKLLQSLMLQLIIY